MIFPQIPGYLLETHLGKGAFGSVYQALWNEDFPCAVKVLGEGALHRDYLGMVLEQLLGLPPHDGVLPVYAFDLEDAVPHLSMALLPGGSVTFDDLAGQLTRDEAWALLRQLADALAWLHGHGLVHAGLTGGNVFVMAEEDGTPRALLADVGQAWLGDGAMEHLHDQAPYVPPERWRDPSRVLQDGHAETWDVYAFGVLAWRLLNGHWPRASQLFDRVLASRGETLTVDPPAFAEWLSEEPAPVWQNQAGDAAGAEARDVVLRCLALDPAERPASMIEVAQVLHEGCREAALASTAGEAMASKPVPGLEAVFRAVFPVNPAADLPEAVTMPLAAVVPAAGPSPDEPFVEALPAEEVLISARTEGAAAAREGAGRRLAVAASVALGLGGMAAAYYQWKEATSSRAGLNQATGESDRARSQVELAENKWRALEDQQATLRVAHLAQIREEWIRLVAALLEVRPSEQAAVEAWKPAAGPIDAASLATWQPAAGPIADRLKQALAAADAEPSLADGSLEGRWQLAALYSALGRIDEALPVLEHLARDLEMGVASGAVPDDAHRLLAARTGSRRGAILWESRRTMEAAPLLQSASQAYETWLASHPDRHDIAREYAENSLLEGRALTERQQPEEARTALTRVAALLGQPGEAGFLPQDHFSLSDSLMELAALDGPDGKLPQAIEYHMQAVRLLVSYDQETHLSVPCRRRLADGYFGLGRLLTKNGTARDASVAFSEAVKLLTELSKESPAESSYRLQMALTYNEVAQLIRVSRPNVAGAREALEYQNGSITILRNLNEANTLDNIFRHHLAAALVLNGELQEAAGDAKNALLRHTEALALIGELLAEPMLAETAGRECRRLSARAWTAMGGIQEKAGDKDEAIASLSKALEAWSGFAGHDPAADQNVASTRERLRKLKPDS